MCFEVSSNTFLFDLLMKTYDNVILLLIKSRGRSDHIILPSLCYFRQLHSVLHVNIPIELLHIAFALVLKI